MTASDTALFDPFSIKEELAQIQARLQALHDAWKEGVDRGEVSSPSGPKLVRALERASSWLGDVTAPLTPDEEREWSGDPSDEADRGVVGMLHDMHQDERSYELAETIIETMCDADKRDEIENEREYRKAEGIG